MPSEAPKQVFIIGLSSNVSVVCFELSAALYTTMNFLHGFQLDHSYGSALLQLWHLHKIPKLIKP
jgi:hypothetical protein